MELQRVIRARQNDDGNAAVIIDNERVKREYTHIQAFAVCLSSVL